MKEKILHYYYDDNAKNLEELVRLVLRKLPEHGETSDFYEMANEIFVDVLNRWDGERDFRGILYVALLNKFKTYFTRMNREKRKADKESVSINSVIPGSDNVTYGESIADKRDCYKKLFEEESNKISLFKRKLSRKQIAIVELLEDGYDIREIATVLNMNTNEFNRHMVSIRSYENVSVLY